MGLRIQGSGGALRFRIVFLLFLLRGRGFFGVQFRDVSVWGFRRSRVWTLVEHQAPHALEGGAAD